VLRTYEPCLPTKADKVPVGEQWVHEIKHDGYRLIARRVDDRVSLYTKGGYNWAGRYPRVVAALSLLKVQSVVIDGEVTWIKEDGTSDFNALHSRLYDDWRPCAHSICWNLTAWTIAASRSWTAKRR